VIVDSSKCGGKRCNDLAGAFENPKSVKEIRFVPVMATGTEPDSIAVAMRAVFQGALERHPEAAGDLS
jgi:hypothetical protein